MDKVNEIEFKKLDKEMDIFLNGFKLLLETCPNVQVVGMAFSIVNDKTMIHNIINYGVDDIFVISIAEIIKQRSLKRIVKIDMK